VDLHAALPTLLPKAIAWAEAESATPLLAFSGVVAAHLTPGHKEDQWIVVFISKP
jgi:hypothetical protein